jgi:hypothetical protein
MTIKHTKLPHQKHRPNSYKIYQNIPLQGPAKLKQIGIFGLQIYHLATLVKCWG